MYVILQKGVDSYGTITDGKVAFFSGAAEG